MAAYKRRLQYIDRYVNKDVNKQYYDTRITRNVLKRPEIMLILLTRPLKGIILRHSHLILFSQREKRDIRRHVGFLSTNSCDEMCPKNTDLESKTSI